MVATKCLVANLVQFLIQRRGYRGFVQKWRAWIIPYRLRVNWSRIMDVVIPHLPDVPMKGDTSVGIPMRHCHRLF